MKTWNQLFIQQGFNVKEVEEKQFEISEETAENLNFLLESLNKAGVQYSIDRHHLIMESSPISIEEWIQVVDFKNRGKGEGLWFRSESEEPKVYELDTYISGIVRELNRLELFTIGSCDGHDNRTPTIYVKNDEDIENAVKVLVASGMNKIYVSNKQLKLIVNNRKQLLEIAENLHVIKTEWLSKDIEFLKQQQFNHLLEQLLLIPGESGNEATIRSFVMELLKDFVDYITMDHYGNILAQKTYRTGLGPTILLNAHLDTIYDFEPERQIIKNGPIWSSSQGILGADDRAGVAVILETGKRLANSNFNGKVKFIFTVEEEIGLVGASAVNEYFLWNVDAAIVVDRRGTNDIVTSCGGYIPFCHKEYGHFFEKVAEKQGLTGWKCRTGGSSDTRIWAEHGIQSVNLSAGYQHEHSGHEQLDVEASYNVLNLIKGVFLNSRELRETLRNINRSKCTQTIVAK